MKLNPVYSFIKDVDEFTYSEVVQACRSSVVDLHYIHCAFFYFAQYCYIKQVGTEMPEQIVTHVTAIPDFDDDVILDFGGNGKKPVKLKKKKFSIFRAEGKKHYGYRAFDYNDNPNFFTMGKFHKTELFKEFKGMTNPFLRRPFGELIDLDGKKFKKETFNYSTHNQEKPKEVWSDLGWTQISDKVRAEIERALYYIAVHNYGDKTGFPLKPEDRTKQWQRIVDLGVEFQNLWYKCWDHDKTVGWSKQRKALEMYKMYVQVDSETENMC